MLHPGLAGAQAAEDFKRARRQAALQDVLARFTGKSNDLLPFEEIRQKLRARQSSSRTLQDIPLDAIIGSVGRYTDFTRSFMPRNDSDGDRWSRVKTAMGEMMGVPPIEVYQLGDAYFVLDGNHRVSVARQLGEKHIQAYVIPVQTRVPFERGTSPDQLILKAEYADFLERTDLDRSRPRANLQMTAPGHYQTLVDEIEQTRHWLKEHRDQEISFRDAAADWYDHVYLPIVQAIRDQGLLRDFPDRTETDLYAWIAKHRTNLASSLGWNIQPSNMLRNLVQERSTQPQEIGKRLLSALTPDVFESGPPTGQWRQERTAEQASNLFTSILVPVSGEPAGWFALEQAIVVAQKEGGRIYGLHVVPPDQQRGEAQQVLREEFYWRCQVGEVEGVLGIETGNVSERIVHHSRLMDLIVLNLAYPPGRLPSERLRSGFRAIIQRSPRPILAVPQTLSYCQRPLLCYDGSPKAEEALFIAAYLAEQWQAALTVLTVTENGSVGSATLEQARQHLEAYNIQATYLNERGPVDAVVLQTTRAQNCDLLLLGGYSLQPVLGVVIGSTVDRLLRISQQPMLICR